MSGVDIAGLVEQVQVAAEITGDELLQAAADALLAQAAELAEARAYREELLKIAADVGEPDDPFAAWEVVQAATRQRDEALAALKASEERGERLSDEARNWEARYTNERELRIMLESLLNSARREIAALRQSPEAQAAIRREALR